MPLIRQSAAGCGSCVRDNNKTEGGYCQDRGHPGGPEASITARVATVAFHPGEAVAAGGQVRWGTGQRPVQTAGLQVGAIEETG